MISQPAAAQEGKWTIILDSDQFGASDVSCASSDDCVVAATLPSGMMVIRTIDRGESWDTLLIDTAYGIGPDTHLPLEFNEIAHPDSSLIVLTCDDSIAMKYSSDGGRSWTVHYFTPGHFSRLHDMNFRNGRMGAVISMPERIYYTLDGCETWREILLPDTLRHNFVMLSVRFFSDSSLIWLGRGDLEDSSRVVWRTTDLGKTWQGTPGPMHGRSLVFVDDRNGWSVGARRVLNDSFGNKMGDVISRTTDGGRTWRVQLDTFSLPSQGLYSSAFADTLHGFAAGAYYTIFQTSDGGESWRLRPESHKEWTPIRIAYPEPDFALGIGGIAGVFRYTTTSGIRATDDGTALTGRVRLLPNVIAPSDRAIIVVEGIETGWIEFEIVDELGRTLLCDRQSLNGNRTSLALATAEVPRGRYFLHWRTGTGQGVEPLIVR